MKKILMFCLFFIFLENMLFSQNVILPLCIEIGDTIDVKEKEKYFLLPEYTSTLFNYGIFYKGFANNKIFVEVNINDSVYLKYFPIGKYDSLIRRVNQLEKFYKFEASNQNSINNISVNNNKPENIDQENSTIERIDKKLLQKKYSYWRLDISTFVKHNEISHDYVPRSYFNVETNMSYDTRIGIAFKSKSIFSINIGLMYQNTPISLGYEMLLINNSNHDSVLTNVNEIGKIHYFGWYSQVNIEAKYFFVGIGLQFTFNNWIKLKRNYEYQGISVIENVNNSYIVKSFEKMNSIYLTLGPKIKFAKKYELRPTFNICFLNSPLLTTKIKYYQDSFLNQTLTNLKVYSTSMYFGVSFRYHL